MKRFVRFLSRGSLHVLPFALWLLIVCYPNPLIFFRNFARYIPFPVDPGIASQIKMPVPDEPNAIEASVKKLVPYQYDWVTYRVLWFMPTPREVLASGKGDCESRAVVLASLLRAKGIPYEIKASFSHIWVDYPGKKRKRIENDEVAYIGTRKGRLFLKLPSIWELRDHFQAQKKGLWDAMPTTRTLLLFGGWVGLGVWKIWHRKRSRRLRQD